MSQPTTQQMRLAGKLYGLAILANLDAGDNACAYGDEVRKYAAKQAERALKRLGIAPSSINDEDMAVRFAKAIKPTPKPHPAR